MGMSPLIRSRIFSGMDSTISVATNPGVTALTVRPMPLSAILPARPIWKHASRASVFVRPNSPDLEAA